LGGKHLNLWEEQLLVYRDPVVGVFFPGRVTR